MDSRTIRLVQASWARAAAHPDLAERFYARLFAVAPAVRPMFSDDIESQARKLAHTLDAFATPLDDLDAFIPRLRELGVRHDGYGAVEAHYNAVGDVLIDTLSEVLGAEFTPETEIAWATVYALMARTMLSAVNAARRSAGAA